ncbi:hypothetical protein FHW12_004241 [Dokdonella fugitiva]|uniref:Uncharacterized protein n=1 Tax=Dokdonella fugitiva TaxID=328517 RepID=A0A839FD47_9GAMM|nr:hypothetical protein [Dokdonella fugitiva]MBA8889994.1 hypothetical protein [Dokdonella fugitiva]
MTIKLFGIWFPVSGNGLRSIEGNVASLAPGLQVRVKDDSRVVTRSGSDFATLAFDVVDAMSRTIFRFKSDGIPLEATPGINQFRLGTGLATAVGGCFGNLAPVDGEAHVRLAKGADLRFHAYEWQLAAEKDVLWLRNSQAQSLEYAGAAAPLSFRTGDAFAMTVDLHSAQIILAPGALRAEILAWHSANGARPPPLAILPSGEMRLPLNPYEASGTPLRFGETVATTRIPLHVANVDGKWIVGVVARNACLDVTFNDAGGPPGNWKAAATRLAGRAGKSFQLESSGVATLGGNALVVNVAQPIPVVQMLPRLGSASVPPRPSTLMLAESMTAASVDSAKVYGPLRGATFDLGPSPECAVIVRKAANESTLPILKVKGLLGLHTARPGDSWNVSAGPVDSAQWFLQGKELDLPLLPACAWDIDAQASQAINSAADKALQTFTQTHVPVTHETGVVESATSATPLITKVATAFTTQDGPPGSLSSNKSSRRPAGIVLAPHDVKQVFGLVSVDVRRDAQAYADAMQAALLEDLAALESTVKGFAALSLVRAKEMAKLLPRPGGALPGIRGMVRKYGKRPLLALAKMGRGKSVVEYLKDAWLELDATKPDSIGSIYPPLVGESEDGRWKDVEDAFRHMLPQQVLANDWVGVLLLNVECDVVSPLFKALLQSKSQEDKHVISLPFVAITAGKADIDAVSTRIRQVRKPTPPAPGKDLQEATFAVHYFDLEIARGELTSFAFDSTLALRSLLGVPAQANVRHDASDLRHGIRIQGQLQQVAGRGELSFGGAIDPPLTLIDLMEEKLEGSPLPIRRLRLSHIGVVEYKNDVRLVLDGDLTPWDFGWGKDKFLKGTIPKSDTDPLIRFVGLGIRLPSMTDDALQWLRFTYPSLRFDVDVPAIDFFHAFKLSFAGFGIQAPEVTGGLLEEKPSLLSWDVNLIGKKPPPNEAWFATDLDFRFSGLPELAVSSRSNLSFRLRLGVPVDDPTKWADKHVVALSALSFEPLRLNLARVFVLCADTVSVTTGDQSSSFTLGNMSLSVLGTTIVQGLSTIIQATDTHRSFLVEWTPKSACAKGSAPVSCPQCSDGIASGNLGLIGIDWIVGGRGLVLDDDAAKALLSIPLQEAAEADPNEAPVPEAVEDPKRLLPSPGTSATSVGDEWFFAAGLTVPARKAKTADANSQGMTPLYGRLLFFDRHFYGFSLKGRLFKELFKSDIVITAMYIRRTSREHDSFYVALTVPMVAFPLLAFTGGQISLEIFANGDFNFDFGFPHARPQGGREWNRALGVIITPFQGSGGFYLAKLTNELKTPDGASHHLIDFRAGLAVQVGLGVVYSSGPVTAWVTLGVYVIFVGQLTLRFDGNVATPKSLAIEGAQISGALGVLLRGGAQLDWWIISVRIEVMASAEIQATLSFGRRSDGECYSQLGGCTNEKCTEELAKKVTLNLAFDLYVGVSASACIGSKPFRVCKSITVSLHMPVNYCLRLN